MSDGDEHGARPGRRTGIPANGMKMHDKRKVAYAVIMGTCLTLVILAWTVVRVYSVTAAVVMSIVALLMPPVAAMVANAGDEQRPRR
jgi:multisubunit Na+/H+ antiporter MnhG subunit